MPLITGIALNALKDQTSLATIQGNLTYLQSRVVSLTAPPGQSRPSETGEQELAPGEAFVGQGFRSTRVLVQDFPGSEKIPSSPPGDFKATWSQAREAVS